MNVSQRIRMFTAYWHTVANISLQIPTMTLAMQMHYTQSRTCCKHFNTCTQQNLAMHSNLTLKYWLRSRPDQQIQTRLTLFPKSFSAFPHGICLLSVPSKCWTSDETYHPLCAPCSRNVILRQHTVYTWSAHDNQDYHHHWYSFPRDMHMRHCW
jgi:hypothetical protein